MLRYPERQPNRALRQDEQEIVALPIFGVLNEVPKNEIYSQRIERIRREEQTEQSIISKIAATYVDASKHYGLGQALAFSRANDRVLRTLIRRPLRDRSTQDRWFRDLRKEMDRLLFEDGTIDAKQRSKIIDRRDEAMIKSMDQLLPFIEGIQRNNPGDILATGVELDVDLGIDLIRGTPTWDEVSSQLIIDIDLYQAKGTRIDEDMLRILASEYQDWAIRAQRLLIDPDWFGQRGREQSQDRFLAMSNDDLFNILIGEKSVAPEVNLTPAGRFFQRMELINQLNELARQFGEAEVARPVVILRNLDYRLLTKDLNGTNSDISIWDILQRKAA